MQNGMSQEGIEIKVAKRDQNAEKIMKQMTKWMRMICIYEG